MAGFGGTADWNRSKCRRWPVCCCVGSLYFLGHARVAQNADDNAVRVHGVLKFVMTLVTLAGEQQLNMQTVGFLHRRAMHNHIHALKQAVSLPGNAATPQADEGGVLGIAPANHADDVCQPIHLGNGTRLWTSSTVFLSRAIARGVRSCVAACLLDVACQGADKIVSKLAVEHCVAKSKVGNIRPCGLASLNLLKTDRQIAKICLERNRSHDHSGRVCRHEAPPPAEGERPRWLAIRASGIRVPTRIGHRTRSLPRLPPLALENLSPSQSAARLGAPLLEEDTEECDGGSDLLRRLGFSPAHLRPRVPWRRIGLHNAPRAPRGGVLDPYQWLQSFHPKGWSALGCPAPTSPDETLARDNSPLGATAGTDIPTSQLRMLADMPTWVHTRVLLCARM